MVVFPKRPNTCGAELDPLILKQYIGTVIIIKEFTAGDFKASHIKISRNQCDARGQVFDQAAVVGRQPCFVAEGPGRGLFLGAAGVDRQGVAVAAHVQIDHDAGLPVPFGFQQLAAAVAGLLAVQEGEGRPHAAAPQGFGQRHQDAEGGGVVVGAHAARVGVVVGAQQWAGGAAGRQQQVVAGCPALLVRLTFLHGKVQALAGQQGFQGGAPRQQVGLGQFGQVFIQICHRGHLIVCLLS